jgi:hypothetical protein
MTLLTKLPAAFFHAVEVYVYTLVGFLVADKTGALDLTELRSAAVAAIPAGIAAVRATVASFGEDATVEASARGPQDDLQDVK